jgi:hypothetical protein
MAKKGIFPLMGGETHTTTAATTWGNNTTKEVGLIKIDGNHAVTFDSTNYPADPGDLVVVINVNSSSPAVSITPDPFSDSDADSYSCGPGDTVTVLYTADNGWIFFSVAAAS